MLSVLVFLVLFCWIGIPVLAVMVGVLAYVLQTPYRWRKRRQQERVC